MNQCDPEAARRINPHDTYRMIRALEVYESTGQTISSIQKEHPRKQYYQTLKIGLTLEREELYTHINQRVGMMIAQGLLDEVCSLLDRGYTQELKSMQSIGYRHLADFLHGKTDWDETIRTMGRDTRRYAKRQLTWFKKEADVHWFNPQQYTQILALIKQKIK